MTDSLSRLTSIFESAKDLTIEAAVSASSRLADTPSGLRPQEISKLLNSRVERDVLNGMKCVISMMSRGEDGLPYFADIVKNITSSSSKVRNLVLVYITRYAEMEPDTALLSINSIQKSLSDKNPISRANSIKSLSGIRIPSISPILLLCVKRTVNDNSGLVRASTAIAIGKIYEIDKSNEKPLLEYLDKLLADADPFVVGTAIKAYSKLTSQLKSPQKKWGSIHGHFRRFCKLINDFDEWTQAIVIDLLTDYSRNFLPRPKLYFVSQDNLIIDLPDQLSDIPPYDYEVSFDDDLQLFLDCLQDLCYSSSEFVILSITRALVSLTPVKTIKQYQIASMLCGMMTKSHKNQLEVFALETISLLVLIDKQIFAPYYRNFYIFPSDSTNVAKLKLGLLSQLVDENNIKYIIEELKYNALESTDLIIANESIKSIGHCSTVSNEWNDKILKWCLKNIKNTNSQVLGELLTVIRFLIQTQQQLVVNEVARNNKILKIVYNLSLILKDDQMSLDSSTKASIIWIIGEFTKECNNEIAPDVLRSLLKGFANEPESVRYQGLVLAAKLYSVTLDDFKNTHEHDPNIIQEFVDTDITSKMFMNVLTLCKYDSSYDTRDRARMINVLLNSGAEQSQLASLFLQAPKPPPCVRSIGDDNNQNKVLLGFFEVPNWAEQDSLPSSKIRKEAPVQENKLSGGAISSGISSSSIAQKIGEIPNTTHSITSQQFHRDNKNGEKPTYQLQSLDEFFGDDDEEDSEEEDDEEEDEDSDDDSDDNDSDDNDSDDDSDDDDSDEGSDEDQVSDSSNVSSESSQQSRSNDSEDEESDDNLLQSHT